MGGSLAPYSQTVGSLLRTFWPEKNGKMNLAKSEFDEPCVDLQLKFIKIYLIFLFQALSCLQVSIS
jgi:hypothetical protein